MKIVIKEGNKTKLWIGIPSCLLFNRVSAAIIHSKMKKEGKNIKTKDLVKFFKALNKYRRRHRDWVIVDILSSENDSVKIKL